jgi:8-oxo-dGTP pyrophosphatase MutT (NUDIX family)
MEIVVSGEKVKYKGLPFKSWNLFVPGIRFSFHDFKRFNKQYVSIELPESKIRVFLRTAIFLEVTGVPNEDESQYVIVHDIGKKGKGSWDPPKGQVEYKEYEEVSRRHRLPNTTLHALLREGVRREVVEETRINLNDVFDLREIPYLAIAGKHEDLPKNFHYQYNIFEGKITYKTFMKAKAKMDHLRANPHLTITMPKDIIEKDEIRLWKPSDGLDMIMDGDPKKLIQLYLDYKGY